MKSRTASVLSQMVTPDFKSRAREKERENLTKLAALAAEQKADIVVLWALGDLDGPLADEVKIGLCKRRAFQSQVYAMRAARSRALAHRIEVYVRGEGAGLRLKTAIVEHLRELGHEIDEPWFRARPDVLQTTLVEMALSEGVRLLSDDEAKAIEQNEINKLMDRTLG